MLMMVSYKPSGSRQEAYVSDDFCPLTGVALDQDILFFAELRVSSREVRRQREQADIMQQRGIIEILLLFSGHASGAAKGMRIASRAFSMSDVVR
jgi:hypothetical protein